MRNAFRHARAALLAILAWPWSAIAAPSAPPIVHISSGAIEGVSGDVAAFKGVPFAAPPVGPLRWRPPQPAAHWDGILDAGHFGHDCMQTPYVIPSGQTPSEDCLTINVWTPSLGAKSKAPVMVFIYGGAFIGGSGAYPLYDGAALARRGVVVVSFNYRVGVFGFLAHPALTAESPTHSSGDYGLLDQIAALKWVQAEIGAFGGDASNVTVFGESAGAVSIALLMTSPLAKGLFQHAILQSAGLPPALPDLASAERSGRALGDDLTALRATPAEALLGTNFRFSPHQWGMAALPFPMPLVDGYVLPRQPLTAFREGDISAVPTLIGINADEGRMFAPAPKDATLAGYEAWTDRAFGTLAGAFRAMHPASSDAEALRAITWADGDSLFGYSTRLIARSVAPRQPSTYSYVFTMHRADRPPPTHSEELPYVFGTLDQPAFIAHPAPDAADLKLSDAMMAAWVRFAATGNPNGPGLPAWPAYDQGDEPYLSLGAAPTVGHAFRRPELDLMERVYAGPVSRP